MNETRKRRWWPFVLGGIAVVVVALVLAFRWDWLIPLIEPRVSAALGRDVRIAHLHVTLGRVTHVVVDDLAIGNPPGWSGGGNLATVEHVVVDVDAMRLIRDRAVVLPSVTLDRPAIDAMQQADGTANWTFASSDQSSNAQSGPSPQIGKLVINDGTAHVRTDKLHGDFQVEISTRSGGSDGKDQIVARARGTYAQQPITAEFVGGALLSLRDQSEPYPVDLRLTNGPTTASAQGSIQDPLAFKGANVRLEFAGPDMSLLLPLTGIAIPKTPPYRISGKLDFAAGVVKFTDTAGKVGSSDLEGDYNVDTKPTRPVLTADLHSRLIDLKDLGGFIGAQPGDADMGTKPPTRSNGKVLPDTPISVPRLTAADVHLTYRASRIEGRRQPLDNMLAKLDIDDGVITLHPLSFGIGQGKIVANVDLRPTSEVLAAKLDVDFQRVDVSKLLSATGVAEGAGAIGGRLAIVGSGRSVAQILGNGSGEARLYMGAGGNLSALLVDISGLQFGNALLSVLGIPTRTKVDCLVTDLVLRDGEATSRLTMLDTEDQRVGITGGVNLRTEAIGLRLRTEAKHFSIGSLPTDIGIEGTLGSPQINPNLGEVGARAAASAGLGVALTPLAALLPTIQTGIGDDHACTGLLREVQAPPRVPASPPPRRTPRRR